jgi:hypothetical protein
MAVRRTTAVRLACVLIAGTPLLACSKAGEEDDLAGNVGERSDRVEDQFGRGFGEKFRADPNSEPANIEDGDVTPVSATTDPIDVD